MILEGPDRYQISYTADNFEIQCPLGTPRFSGIASSKKPKLYIASIDNRPVYVGITKQSLRQRLRLGWNATGETGYHGYAWRREGSQAVLDVWAHVDALERNERDIETVEAEIVFLIRLITGQWPKSQTEIHFYPSSEVHRNAARAIVGHYGLLIPERLPDYLAVSDNAGFSANT